MTSAPTPAGTASTSPRTRWYLQLFPQLAVGVIAGIVVGWAFKDFGADLKPLATGFTKLIKMVIAPIIFCMVVVGIAHVGNLKAVGKIGVKALIYFEVVTTAALIFGILIGNLLKPGAGFDIDPAVIADGQEALDQKTGDGELPHTVDFLLGIIPDSAVAAFTGVAANSTLQVLFFSILFGLALAKFGETGPPIVMEIIEHIGAIFFQIMGWIMRLSPIAAFGAMASIIGQYGIDSLGSFAKLIGACYLAAVLFIGVIGIIARVFCGINIFKLFRYLKDEFLLALGTASTEAVLPATMNKLINAGCSRASTGLVMPTGYSFNLDGATLYLSICIIFLAQAVGVDLSLGEQVGAVLVLMLTSKGMAGVPGAAFLTLSATVDSLNHPQITVPLVAILLGADRIMDSMRVTVNLIGNCVATFVVAAWEKELDFDRMRRVLDGEVLPPIGFDDDEPADGRDVVTAGSMANLKE